MRKAVITGITAVVIAVSSAAFAQQQPFTFPAMHGGGLTAEDMSALADARIAGFKAALRLTPTQEGLWRPVEQAIREVFKQRAERMDHSDARSAIDPMVRLRGRVDARVGITNGLKGVVDAMEPLYRSLDEAQRRRFAFMLRSAAARRVAFAHAFHLHHLGGMP